MQWQGKSFCCVLMAMVLLIFTGTLRANVSTLPLLATGNHLGLIIGFNASHPVATEQSITQHWHQAINAGMRSGRVQMDWYALEPQPGVYHLQELTSQLKWLSDAGVQPFLLISTVASEGFSLPADLLDSHSSTGLFEGRHLDDPIIQARFNQLMDQVVPLLVAHQGWAISIGNEPGNLLEHQPQHETPMVNFLRNAREHIHQLNEQMAVTMTLAYFNVELGYNFHRQILQYSDFACFNYYATTGDVFFDGTKDIVEQEIDHMLTLAEGKLLVLQELGAAAGFTDKPSTMQANEQKQAVFFEHVFDKLNREARFRAAYIFQMVDWDPQLVDSYYTQVLLAEGLSVDFATRFAESLETTGLIKLSNGGERAAWPVFIKWVQTYGGVIKEDLPLPLWSQQLLIMSLIFIVIFRRNV